VAFQASFEPPSLNGGGLYLGSPTSPPQKIALFGETAPGTGGGVYRDQQIIGLNNAGELAFISNIMGGTTNRAIFVGTPSAVTMVAAAGEPAPGTAGAFNLNATNGATAWLNASGDVAFAAQVSGGGQGIWIGNTAGPPAKLMVNTDPTGTSLGGNFGSPVAVRGFNTAGEVLFNTNPDSGATSNHALFLKDLAGPAQVVFASGQAAPGGTTETFANTAQALLNDSGNVAFLSQLQSGPSLFGWFLGSGSSMPVKIALQGEITPVGGTFGLAGEANLPAQFNLSGKLVFLADILGPNAIGAFQWRPGSGIVSIVNTNDALPSGANAVIRQFQPGASDDQMLFTASKAGGRGTVFTRSLRSGGKITRLFSEGDTAPGIGGNLWRVASGNFGVINNSEEAAFFASSVVGGTPGPASLLFTYKPGFGLRKVAATGDSAPGAGGGTFANFPTSTQPPFRINSSGQIAFVANINGSVGNASRQGVFIASAAGPAQAVARMGDTSPLPGSTFLNFQAGSVSLNDNGQVAFQAMSVVPGPAQVPGLFVGSGLFAPLKLVALGDSGPGGSTVGLIPIRLQMNNAGQVAYVAGLTGGSASQGVFVGTAGATQTALALTGNPAPSTAGGLFSLFTETEIEINNSGQVAFRGEVSSSGVSSGYFLGSATAPLAARLVQGQTLPGGGAAGYLSPGLNNFIGERFTLADSGELEIDVENVVGAPNLPRHVIASSSGVLRAFAATGDPAAGTSSQYGLLFQSVGVNSSGRFFFTAILVEGPAKWGIFWDGS
jgi:hypothetical protein